MLKSSIPDTPQKAAVIARAKSLTDFKWTPLRDMPTYLTNVGNTILPAGKTVTGFPYSSSERTDCFIAENISIETFLSTINNPHSRLYQPAFAALNACNFGIVCNGFVRYALGIPYRVSTSKWDQLDGMIEIKPREKYTVDEIELCDVLHAFGLGRNHVAIITDILKDENDNIVEIEVSEAIRPTCARRRFGVDAFYEKYKLFSLWRYEHLDKVPLYDESTDELLKNIPTPVISVDKGNKSNYLLGENVIISLFTEDKGSVEIFRNGKPYESISILGSAFFPRQLPCGYYVIKFNAHSVEFAVNNGTINYTVDGDKITIYANSNDSNSVIHYMDFRIKGEGVAALSKFEILSEEEKQSGTFTRVIPDDAENFKVYFKNKYGVWVHPMTKI